MATMPSNNATPPGNKVTPAATLVLMRDEGPAEWPQLLMLERSSKMGFGAGAMVFPGGAVDDADFEYAGRLSKAASGALEADEAAYRIAAIRETLEEAGLAIALDSNPTSSIQAEARQRLHDGDSMEALCRDYGWHINFSALVPWARWKPKTHKIRVFDTRFYIADANGVTGHESVDKTENVMMRWVEAHSMLKMRDEGVVSIMFPTLRNLERLGLFRNFTEAAAHAESIPVRLVETYIEDRDGETFLCLAEGHGYPILAEALENLRRS